MRMMGIIFLHLNFQFSAVRVGRLLAKYCVYQQVQQVW